jgi:outer membrane protein assembly factor BamD
MPIARPAVSRTLLVAAVLMAGMLAVSGCSSFGRKKDDRRATADSLYKAAHKSMVSGDYEYAVRQYEALTARYPFTDESRQGRLDIIYVYYRKGEKESATDAAEQFLRENPTHPRIDYAWYMKGLVEFEDQPLAIERWLGVDTAKRPPGQLLSSINAFGTVVRQFPNSAYAHDAQLRLVYLRNRLADYEINVARYYVRRGAWMAAAQRAQRTIEQYDGAPATREALAIMVECYNKLGLKDLEASARQVYELNYAGQTPATSIKRPFWKIW